ncbi:MAG: helix-turn-helix transcriptional regulator [Bacteroidaceae bacterium]|nr:helix-turn-helix transcriptional regulator [Bacteroidaceae bacterium]
MTVKERLIQFINYKNLSAREFCRQCGVSSSFVSNIGKSISGSYLDKISMQFPDLNLSWLLLENGNMLNIQNDNSTLQMESITIPVEAWSVIKQQAASLEARDRQIDTRDRHIDDLIAMLKQQIMPPAASKKAACG